MKMITITVILSVILLFVVLKIISWRVVVPTNEYHIVQRVNTTVEYGKGKQAGNVYYNVPAIIPIFGVKRIVMPATIFDITIFEYEAFDNGRVPFYVDIAGFFRIENSAAASQRISSVEELHNQLESIVASIARTILGKMDINEILESRTELWDKFMQEVSENIKEFGLVCTKNIELMKVYDVPQSNIIYNIQKKKESEIEKDAKVAIETNKKLSETARIEAEKAIALSEANKLKEVWEREAEAEKAVEIANQQKVQEIQIARKLTIEKEMEANLVKETQQAEIEKQRTLIEEEKAKQVKIIKAQAEAWEIKALAQGRKEASQDDAEAIKVKAEAEADAIKRKALAEANWEAEKKKATVADQVELLEKISNNPEYSRYLQAIEAIKMYGKAEQLKAEALKNADIKYLATGWENQYGEFLWKLGLGLETLKEFKGVENISEILSQIVGSFRGDDKKSSETEEFVEVEDDEIQE